MSIRPPISGGQLPLDGPDAIAADEAVLIIDGLFCQTPALTHIELIHALTAGRRVFGAASMGALRAVELAQQGMQGLGCIHAHYAAGLLRDDGDIAEAMCPITWQPLTVPLVRVRRALAIACHRGVPRSRCTRLMRAAAALHFLDRTEARLHEAWHGLLPASQARGVAEIVASPASDIKAIDAGFAVRQLASMAAGARGALPADEGAHDGALYLEDLGKDDR